VKGSKGIRQTLDGKEAAPAPESATATDASEPENQPPSAQKPKSIKRTLGGKRAAQEPEHTSVVSRAKNPSNAEPKPSNASRHKEDEESEAALDDEEAADRKRAELKRQFVAAATHKSKRRKF
jgi:hypothetical protein